MAQKSNTKVDFVRMKLSKMVLNDSRAMFRKDKIKKQRSIDKKTPIKSHRKRKVQRRLFDQSKESLSIRRKKADKFNASAVWRSEYDLLNMITNSVDRKMKETQQNKWKGKTIGIQTSDKRIQLIENLTELNQQILIDSKRKCVKAKDVIQKSDKIVGNALRIKYKLVPVIEGFTLVKNSIPIEYKFSNDNVESVDENNNNALYDITMKPTGKNQSTRYQIANATSFDIESTADYSDFASSLTDNASSTFISDKGYATKKSTPIKRYTFLMHLKLTELYIFFFNSLFNFVTVRRSTVFTRCMSIVRGLFPSKK